MKKSLSLLLVLIIVTTLFAGCAKEEKAVETAPVAEETEEIAEVEEPMDAYPERSINNIVPFGAGGGTDVWNRALSAAMEEPLGVKILVNNMTGGGPGGTGQAYVWDSEHDGYTILGTSETPLLVPVMTGMPQTTEDFEYFIAGGSPGLLLVNKNAGVATIEELIEKSKADPDKYKVASTAGGLWFILANLFSSYGDVPVGNVTYDGSRPAITACVSGETAAVTASAGEVADFIRSGDLIPLVAIQPTDYEFPGYGVIPAVTKSIPSLEKYLPLNQFIGFMVPADTDPARVKVLKDAFEVAMASDEIAKFAEEQYAVMYNLTGDEARAFSAKAQSTMSWILQDMGLTEFSPEDFDIPRP
ncbi:MAG: tripartite tricarboxylate transporter substrate binding protein [Vallitaleaceae bacterium]|nr:tripartite tricarboxylate transporter substrate binding protein [Vallitaleaceae bacterium]